MSSMDERHDILTMGPQVGGQTGIQAEVQTPLLSGQQYALEQVPFPDATSFTPGATRPFAGPITPVGVTRPLVVNNTQPLSQNLPDVLSDMRTTTTSLRQPIVISGRGKRTHPVRPPKARKLVIHIAATFVLSLVLLSALLLVIPTGIDGKSGSSLFAPITNLVNSKDNTAGLIAQQAATATAVTQDGYDPGNSQTYAGVPTAPPSFGGTGGADNHFFWGQCTYWASLRYHQITGLWVPWLGNAWQWASGASASGWVVSSTPHLHAIIVLQPGVEGAGYYGHVAIVEQVNGDGSVVTSNFNWLGNWGRETFVTFRPGPGVSFVWAQGY